MKKIRNQAPEMKIDTPRLKKFAIPFAVSAAAFFGVADVPAAGEAEFAAAQTVSGAAKEKPDKKKLSRRALAHAVYGRIRIVNTPGADFNVRIVPRGTAADCSVRVKPVANMPGEWTFVEVGEDYTVRIVSAAGLEDFTVSLTSNY